MRKKFALERRRITVALLLLAFLGSFIFGLQPVNAQTTDDFTDSPATLIAQTNPQNLGQQAAQQANQVGTQPDPSAATCEATGVEMGWILCPVLRNTYSFFEWLAEDVMADNLLKLDINTQPTQPSGEVNPLYQMWQFFLGLANLLFILAFLAVIYILAVGTTNLTQAVSVQRILPRLVVAVILSYMSIYIVATLISITNDFGTGIADFVLAPLNSADTFEFSGLFSNLSQSGSNLGPNPTGTANGIDNILVEIGILWGITMVIGMIGLQTLIIFGLLGLGVLLAVLIIRIVVIVALMVLAPIAFASLVLPNTENLFKMWWESLWKALIMYPLIMLFIASGQIASRILSATSDNLLMNLVAIAAAFMPFFIIPLTFRLAGAALGSIGRLITGAQQRLKGDPKDFRSIRGQARMRRQQNLEQMMSGTFRPFGLNSLRGLYYPKPMRRFLRRMPWTNVNSGWYNALDQSREQVQKLVGSSRDDVVMATALTGGGYWKGEKVKTEEGAQRWSARLKPGMFWERDPDTGEINTGVGGAHRIFDGSKYREVKTEDFFSGNTMSLVRSYAKDKGFLGASVEVAIDRGVRHEDFMRVVEGLGGANWTGPEKKDIWNSTKYRVKDKAIQFQAMKSSYFQDTPLEVRQRGQGPRPEPSFDLGELASKMSDKGAYWMSNLSSSAWDVMDELVTEQPPVATLADADIDSTRIRDARLVRIGNRAYQFIDGVRGSGVVRDDEGREINLGSQTSPLAADRAEKFYQNFYKYVKANYGGRETPDPRTGIVQMIVYLPDEDGQIRPFRMMPPPPR